VDVSEMQKKLSLWAIENPKGNSTTCSVMRPCHRAKTKADLKVLSRMR
jgi:hypothetical protein